MTNDTQPTIKELLDTAQDLRTRMDASQEIFGRESKMARITELESQSHKEGFWDDAQTAGQIMQEAESLKKSVAGFDDVVQRVADATEMLSEAGENDMALYSDEVHELAVAVEKIETELLLSEPYDAGDAIVTIHAGAGGTDAQDWSEMLMRMYMRWADARGYGVEILDESRGAEAGYKSVTLEVRGRFAYGYLRTEMGTHRLVRLSPFNSDSLRQTSFARVEVLPVLAEDTVEVTLAPADLRVDTYRSQGAGGQSVNTTDSAVRITHIPTGTVATCQNERSQLQNKEQAMKVLRAKLLQKKLEEQKKERAALRGENVSAEWGSQIRSYVLHPYKMVKDHRTGHETPQTQDVLDGAIDAFIDAALKWQSHKR